MEFLIREFLTKNALMAGAGQIVVMDDPFVSPPSQFRPLSANII